MSQKMNWYGLDSDQLQEQIRKAYIAIDVEKEVISNLALDDLERRDKANQRIGYFQCMIENMKSDLLGLYPMSEWQNLPPFSFAEWEKPKTSA